MSTVEPLPALLDTAAAAPLAEKLQARLGQGEPLLLDGSSVTRIGQASLQVLLSARKTAMARNIAFAIRAPSEALASMTNLVGASDLLISVEA